MVEVGLTDAVRSGADLSSVLVNRNDDGANMIYVQKRGRKIKRDSRERRFQRLG